MLLIVCWFPESRLLNYSSALQLVQGSTRRAASAHRHRSKGPENEFWWYYGSPQPRDAGLG